MRARNRRAVAGDQNRAFDADGAVERVLVFFDLLVIQFAITITITIAIAGSRLGFRFGLGLGRSEVKVEREHDFDGLALVSRCLVAQRSDRVARELIELRVDTLLDFDVGGDAVDAHHVLDAHTTGRRLFGGRELLGVGDLGRVEQLGGHKALGRGRGGRRFGLALAFGRCRPGVDGAQSQQCEDRYARDAGFVSHSLSP